MVDWTFVSLNAVWILGLSLIFSSVSLALYSASEQKLKLITVLARKGHILFLDVGMALVCLGLLGLVGSLWEKILWGVLAFGSLASLWMDLHKKGLQDHG